MKPSDDKPPVVLLMGATATGKTAIAMDLVTRFPMDIVSVDSAMIYRGMDIGTAKPTADELRVAPHRLIDILDPVEAYSAARFREDALAEIEQIQSKGRIPLLTGGTMLYFRVLEQGMATMPAADPVVRRRLEAEAKELGWEHMHARLRKVDPKSADRIHPNDPQRLQRALEVYEISGETLTKLYEKSSRDELPFSLIKIALEPDDRSWLHDRIEKRFDLMLRQGFVDEVDALHKRGDLNVELPSMRSVGYRQVWHYLEGEYDQETMRQKGVAATRQLAKRQLTWLRSMTDAKRLSAQGSARSQVSAFLGGRF